MAKRKFTGLIWLWTALVVIGIDRLSKLWVMHHLSFFEPIKILPVLNFTLAYNTGAAFNFLDHAHGWQNIFFSSLAIIVVAIILIWLSKTPAKERWFNIGLCLILSGALGNAWDRLSYGFVVDFLSFHVGSWYFAIFNMADSAICVGAFILFCKWTFWPSKV